jgi:hypothetical protein
MSEFRLFGSRYEVERQSRNGVMISCNTGHFYPVDRWKWWLRWYAMARLFFNERFGCK